VLRSVASLAALKSGLRACRGDLLADRHRQTTPHCRLPGFAPLLGIGKELPIKPLHPAQRGGEVDGRAKGHDGEDQTAGAIRVFASKKFLSLCGGHRAVNKALSSA
jgi:hypothetical protein